MKPILTGGPLGAPPGAWAPVDGWGAAAGAQAPSSSASAMRILTAESLRPFMPRLPLRCDLADALGVGPFPRLPRHACLPHPLPCHPAAEQLPAHGCRPGGAGEEPALHLARVEPLGAHR